jgi:hypothetical protein
MVKLLATILEQPAESPAKSRPEIPKELANVVLHCLAKQKEHRFRTYDELRQALSPFDSTTAVPAPLGLRFCAIVVDGIILFAPMILFFATVPFLVSLTGNGPTPADSGDLVQRIYRWVPRIFLFIWTMLYYAISEGLWGALGEGRLWVASCRWQPWCARFTSRSGADIDFFVHHQFP